MDELQEFQGLLQELLQAIQLSMESGEALPDEMQGQIAQTLELLYNRIESLMGQQIPTTPQAQPELEPAGFPSSNISRFRYDPKSQNLIVQFLGKYPNRDGGTYQYQNVPQNIFNIFRRGAVAPRTSGKNAWHRWEKGKAPSLGASAYALLREGGYNYQRLS